MSFAKDNYKRVHCVKSTHQRPSASESVRQSRDSQPPRCSWQGKKSKEWVSVSVRVRVGFKLGLGLGLGLGIRVSVRKALNLDAKRRDADVGPLENT